MQPTLVLAVLVMGAGCTSSSQTVRQNGLVPRPRADTYDGQPLAHAIQLEGHADTTVTAAANGHDPASGASVARSELGGAARFAIGRDADLGVLFEEALTSGATTTNAENVVAPSSHDSMGFGFAVRDSMPLGGATEHDGWRLGLAGSLTLWRVARREEGGEQLVNGAPVFSASLVPSKRVGNVVLFGSLTLTNQISVPVSFVSSNDGRATDPAVAGGACGLLGFGARIDVGDGVGLLVQAVESIGAPGQNVPMVGAAVTIGVGARTTPPVAPPPS